MHIADSHAYAHCIPLCTYVHDSWSRRSCKKAALARRPNTIPNRPPARPPHIVTYLHSKKSQLLQLLHEMLICCRLRVCREPSVVKGSLLEPAAMQYGIAPASSTRSSSPKGACHAEARRNADLTLFFVCICCMLAQSVPPITPAAAAARRSNITDMDGGANLYLKAACATVWQGTP